jgi:hypothetical protein
MSVSAAVTVKGLLTLIMHAGIVGSTGTLPTRLARP